MSDRQYKSRVYFSTATTGTGTLTVGTAETGFRLPTSDLDTKEIDFIIEDGDAWEKSTGIYTHSGTTLTRVLVESSTASLLVLTGSAKVFIDLNDVAVNNMYRLNNDIATTAPGVGNDNTQGYAVGSRWTDVTADNTYLCQDVSTGAAVWAQTDAAAGSGDLVSTNNLSDVTSAATSLANLGGAALGANSDITSLAGLTTALTVAQGGMGAGTFTDGGILLGSGTAAVTAMGVLADGSIVVGDGTTDPVALAAFSSSTGNLLAAKGGVIGQQTIWVPASAMEAAVTTAAATSNAVEIGTSLFAARTMDFATDADDFAYFGIQMPKSWDAGALLIQFVWSATGTTANTVLWAIAATSLGDDEVLTTAFPTPTSPAADTNSTTADDLMISAEVSVTVGSTPAAEDYVIFEVSRDVSGDTLAEDARLHGIKIHYTIDTGVDD